VTAKPQFGFTPKDFEEREVRLSDDLTAKLKQRKFTSTTDLIFPNPSGKPDGHFLRKIKKMAVRAGMDPNNVGLHIFRKTFATLQHRNGVDARTIQRMLGHSDLATTLAYLEPENVRSEGMAAKVNETFAQFTGMGK
jgi:site-specific recombinase XerD